MSDIYLYLFYDFPGFESVSFYYYYYLLVYFVHCTKMPHLMIPSLLNASGTLISFFGKGGGMM